MSDHIARQALTRMNMNVVAIAPQYGGVAIAADLVQMAKTDSAEAHAKFMEQRRAELCAAYGFDEPSQRKPFAFASGVAIIPVTGTLLNRFGSSYGFVTGYNFIRQQTALALADEDVKGIIYDVNSYGGEAAGCFECSDFVREAGKVKPTMSYIDSNAYSAGYAMASAANRVVSTPSGGAGSIGVIAMHVDMSKWLDEIGLKVSLIYFGDHKADGNPFEPLPADVRASIQSSVNKSGEKFVALVATNMSLDAARVRDTQARTYRAEDALALGLINAIATPEEAAQAFLDELSGSTSNPSTKAEVSMTQATGPDATTGTPAAAASAAQPPAAAAAAQSQANADDVQKAAAEARTAERARVAGITGSEEAKGRETLANHLAMNTDMSVDAAKAVLAASPKADTKSGANGFAAAMSNSQHPNVGEAAGAGEGGTEQLSAADRILAAQTAATGFKPEAAKK